MKGLRAAGSWRKLSEKLEPRRYAREAHSITDALIYILQANFSEKTENANETLANCWTKEIYKSEE